MIRIVVLVLAAANLLFLGWSQWIRDAEPRLIAPGAMSTASTIAPPPAESAAPCATVGPIREEVRAMEIEQLLRDMQLHPLRRSVIAEVPDGWWVYVASANAAGQSRALRAIRNAGLGDAIAMPDDPEFRVSLGVFSEESRARNRASAVEALRLEPVVAQRMAQETSFWFELPGTAPASVDLAELGAEGVDITALQVQACEDGDEVSIETIMPTGATADEAAQGAAL